MRRKTEVVIPESLQGLPIDEKLGIVIPYTTYLDPGGNPDYRINDQVKRIACLVDKKCAICGKPLGRYKWFVGGDKCRENHYFVDAAMHKECMDYAFLVCPFLLGNQDYSLKNHKIQDGQVLSLEQVSPKRPINMYGFKCKDYELVSISDQVFVYVEEFMSVELKHSMT